MIPSPLDIKVLKTFIICNKLLSHVSEEQFFGGWGIFSPMHGGHLFKDMNLGAEPIFWLGDARGTFSPETAIQN